MKVIICTIVVSLIILISTIGVKVYDYYDNIKECERLDSIHIELSKQLDIEREAKLKKLRSMGEF